jgi:phage shock protein A
MKPMKLNVYRIVPLLAVVALASMLTTGCGGSQELETSLGEVSSFSNKFSQAEIRAGEWERTAQTALTNLSLAAVDFASLSNRFIQVKGQLIEAEGRRSIAEVHAGQRAARIAELEAQQTETTTLINQLREENARVAARGDEARRQIAEANAKAQAAANEREILKARVAEMEVLLNNPDWLRAQLKRMRVSAPAGRPVPSSATSASAQPAASSEIPSMAASAFEPNYPAMKSRAKAPLMMLPDGSVRAVPPSAAK